MIVAITGAGGYIGSLLIKSLEDYETIPLVHSEKGLENERVVDVTSYESVKKGLRGVDQVVHLAALSKPEQCEENKELARSVNVRGTRNVLKACEELGVEHVVFASTIYVYGKNQGTKKEDDTLNPQNHYAETKALAEELCEKYRECFPVTILRFSFVYGPGQEGGVVSDFIKKIRGGEVLEMLSSREQVLGLIHVSDVLRAIKKSLQKKPGRTLNISPQEKTSLEELANTIMRALNKRVGIKDVPNKKSSILTSPEKAWRALNWVAETSLEQGITELVQ